MMNWQPSIWARIVVAIGYLVIAVVLFAIHETIMVVWANQPEIPWLIWLAQSCLYIATIAAAVCSGLSIGKALGDRIQRRKNAR